MTPTRVIAAPYKEQLVGATKQSLMIPTDAGVFPLRELSDVLGLARETLRQRLMNTPSAWENPDILKRGHYQIVIDGQRPNKLPRGGRRRDPESIKIGTWERQQMRATR